MHKIILAGFFSLWSLASAYATNLPGLLNDATVDCTLTGTGTCVVATNGAGTVSFNLSSSAASGLTYNFQGSSDGTHWFTVAYGDPTTNPIAFSYTTSSATSGQWIIGVAGFQQIRFNLTAYGGGTLTVHGEAGAGSNITYVVGGAISVSGGASGGTSLADEAAFTEGTTAFTPAGCYFKTSVTSLTTGQAGSFACTADRMLFTNLGKVGGTAIDTNSGSKSAGTQRVVLATDQPALTNPQPVSFSIGNAQTQPHVCGSTSTFKHITSATDTQLIAASGSTTIYICDIRFSASAGLNFFLEKSSSGTCGSPTQIDILVTAAANEAHLPSDAFYQGLNTGASQQLCVNTSGGNLDISVVFDQY